MDICIFQDASEGRIILEKAIEMRDNSIEDINNAKENIDKGIMDFLADPAAALFHVPLNVALTTCNVIIVICICFMRNSR